MKKSALLLSACVLTACSGNPTPESGKPADTQATADTAQTGESTGVGVSPHSKEGVIRIATESTYKPFTFLDSNGKVVGFEVDLANAMCAKMSRECEVISQDWSSLIPGLQAGKYEAIMSGMSITDERRQVVDFGVPYFNNALVLVAKKDQQVSINDVDGKNVAVQQATVSADYIKEHHPKALIKTYDRQTSAYQDLQNGRVDFMLSDIGPMSDWLKSEQGASFEVKGESIDIDDEIAMAFVKGDPLKDDFNKALDAVKQSGEFDKIYANYFSK